jgi:hypothetical protein
MPGGCKRDLKATPAGVLTKKAQPAKTAPNGIRCRSSAFAAAAFPFPYKERFRISDWAGIGNSGEYVPGVSIPPDAPLRTNHRPRFEAWPRFEARRRSRPSSVGGLQAQLRSGSNCVRGRCQRSIRVVKVKSFNGWSRGARLQRRVWLEVMSQAEPFADLLGRHLLCDREPARFDLLSALTAA